MAFHHVEWSDCSHHPHMSEAQALLDHFWENNRMRPAPPASPEAVHRNEAAETSKAVVHRGIRSAPVANRMLGPVIMTLVVGSWLPIGLLVDLLDASPMVKIGIIMVAVYVTLAFGYYALKRLGVD